MRETNENKEPVAVGSDSNDGLGVRTKEYAYWLADKIQAFGDYGKDCAYCLREQADRIERLEHLVARDIDPMDCTEEDALLVREAHRTAFPENYRDA